MTAPRTTRVKDEPIARPAATHSSLPGTWDYHVLPPSTRGMAVGTEKKGGAPRELRIKRRALEKTLRAVVDFYFFLSVFMMLQVA